MKRENHKNIFFNDNIISGSEFQAIIDKTDPFKIKFYNNF